MIQAKQCQFVYHLGSIVKLSRQQVPHSIWGRKDINIWHNFVHLENVNLFLLDKYLKIKKRKTFKTKNLLSLARPVTGSQLLFKWQVKWILKLFHKTTKWKEVSALYKSRYQLLVIVRNQPILLLQPPPPRPPPPPPKKLLTWFLCLF